MSLTRTPRARSKTAHALTDPRPTFLSMVKTGANKTPFKAIRSAKLVGREAEDFLMAVKKSDIAKLAFKADKFPDEAAVQAWLEKGGYDGFTVTKSDDGFEVAGDTTLVDVRRIEAGDVVVYVGTKSEEEAPAIDGETAAKTTSETRTAAVVQKGEAEGTAPAAAKPVEAAPVVEPAVDTAPVVEVAAGAPVDPVADAAPVVEAPVEAAKTEGVTYAADLTAKTITGTNGVQPVAPLDHAAVTATAKAALALLDGSGVEITSRKASMWTVSDIGGLISTLTYLINDADWNGISDADVVILKDAGASLLSVLVSAMQSVIDKHVEAFKSEAEARAKAAAPVDPAIAALTASVAAMQAQLTQLTADNATLATAKSEAEKLAAEAETRAKAAEDARRPARKGADVGDAQTSAPAPRAKSDAELTDSEWVEKRMRSETLGLAGA